MNEQLRMVTISVEAECRLIRIGLLEDGGARVTVDIHGDDGHQIIRSFQAKEFLPKQRYAIVMTRIGDDDRPVFQPAKERADESTLNSGDNSTQRQPASVTGEPPARVKSRGEKVVSLAGMACNDPPFQTWLWDNYGRPDLREARPINPIDKREWARRKIHELTGVGSRKEFADENGDVTESGENFVEIFDAFKNEFRV